MSIIKNKQQKEFDKKLALNRTISQMNKQLQKLEARKKEFIEKAKEAKIHGLKNELTLSLSALKSAHTQEKKIREMKINFEVMVSLKDMLQTTSEFLDGMSSLSKDMVKLTDDKQFAQVSKQFAMAMASTEKQQERMEIFLEDSKDSFSNVSATPSISDEEIMALIDEEIVQDSSKDDIENQLDAIDVKLKAKE